MKYLVALANSKPTQNANYGSIPYIMALTSCTLWPLGWIYANQQNINFAQITILRGLVGIVFNYIICLYTKSPLHLPSPTFKWLSLRNIIMAIHSLVFSLSQFILPLPIVHTIACTSVLFIFIIDYFMFQNKINCKQAIGIIVGIFGSVIASNGRLITKWINPSFEEHTDFPNYITNDPFIIAIFSLVFLLVMAMWGFAIVITKKAEANTFQVGFSLGFFFLFFSSMTYPFIQSKTTPWTLIAATFLSAIPMLFAQLLYNGALTMTKDTGILGLTNFWSIFVVYLVSIFRYKETQDFLTILGGILVFFGVWQTIFNKNKVK